VGVLVRLSGIGKRYGGGPWVLSDVDFDLLTRLSLVGGAWTNYHLPVRM
jgi:hypothetical protein